MAVLSINSRVARGFVGNSVAGPALLAAGTEPWCVDAARFSNHPGHGVHQGRVTSARELRSMIDGVVSLRSADNPLCDAVLTGYLGTPENGAEALGAVRSLRQIGNPALYVCDPVLGDTESGVYVAEGLVRFFRDDALPAADVILPNQFELGLLSGGAVTSLEQTAAAVRLLRHARPDRVVVVTSVAGDGASGGSIGVLVADGDGEWLIEAPMLERRAKGTGDLLAAVFTARLVQRALSRDAARNAAEEAVAFVHRVLEGTREDSLDLDLPNHVAVFGENPARFRARAIA